MFGECRFLGVFLLDRFLVFSEPSIELPFGLPDEEFVAIFAWNGINYPARLIIFWNVKLPMVWCGFKATLIL